ncbi:MAG: type II toxin-antitoxin system VapC family toxin [Geminicoccaceae bacterium]
MLDTNVISELAKLRPAPAVVAWLAVQQPADLFLSAITLGEIDIGARAHPDPARRDRLLAWCDGLQNSLFRDRVLPFDAEAARTWGDLVQSSRSHGRTLEWRDSQIAATAARFGASLATRNARHFAGLGLDLVDPFAAST